ncbi:hypothetical protein M9Y10_014522 [Tritrichomonas musculus]|uniref:Uncharacterized protein n=1 Tax=Tritrichomonas musculus TaxID=1915356 RepID=A0ABR2L1N3_9EUKA
MLLHQHLLASMLLNNIFDSFLTLFGKDSENNFVIAATFADAGEPHVMSALKEANIPTNFVSKFNNSALFAKRSGNDGKYFSLLCYYFRTT